MFSIEELSEMIEKGVNSLKLPDEPIRLYDPIRYTLSSGGKRLRPVLTLAACNLFNNSVSEALYPSLAIEVFHNFTLVHDDIMDEAPLRRNQPTVVAKWNPNVAILSGDTMNVIAYQLLAKTNSQHLDRLLKEFNSLAQAICEGQQLDMDFETAQFITQEEYLNMIELKTATLLKGALRMGAIVAGANSKDVNYLGEFGRNLGIAFQLQDDFLDTYGDPKKFGKRIGGDIIANKKTFLTIKAFALAKGNSLKLLNSYFKAESIDPKNKVEGVIKIFDEVDVKSLAEAEIQKYYSLAVDSLKLVDCSADRKWVLEKLSSKIMGRNN